MIIHWCQPGDWIHVFNVVNFILIVAHLWFIIQLAPVENPIDEWCGIETVGLFPFTVAININVVVKMCATDNYQYYNVIIGLVSSKNNV